MADFVDSESPPAQRAGVGGHAGGPATPTAPLQFTGERFVPSATGELRYEHLHRYAHCASLVRGKRVLDIASGEGYGSAMLRRTAAAVVGVDVSAEAIEHARSRYGHDEHLRFETGTCAAIPLPDRSIDVVVSFETLEHIVEQEQMLREVVRVLHPDGVLILSTPDRETYNARLDAPNEFHLRELDRSEFEALIGRHFRHVAMLGQRLATGSLIYGLDEPFHRGGLQVYTEVDDEVVEATPRLAQPVYQIAVCSNRALPASLPASWYLDTASDLANEHVEVARWARSLQATVESTGQRVLEVQSLHLDAATWAQSLDRELRELQTTHVALQEEHAAMATWAQGLQARLDDAQARVVEVQNQHEAANRWAGDLRAELDAAGLLVRQLQAEHHADALYGQKLAGEMSALQATHVALQTTLVELQTTHVELQTTHVELQTTHVALQTAHVALQEQCETLQASDLAQRRDLEEADAKARALESALATAHARLADLQSENDRAVLLGKTLTEDLDHVQREKATLRSDLAQMNDRAAEIRSEMDTVRAELAALKAEWPMLERDLAQTRMQLLDATRVGGEQQARIAALHAALEAERAVVVALRTSTSWRLTYPLRALKRGLGLAPKNPVTAQTGHWLVLRRMFRSLPIDHSAKERIRMWLFDRFHDQLKHLPWHAVWEAKRTGHGSGLPYPEPVAPPPELTPVEQRSEAAHITVPTSQTPVVSVIIPVYGKLDYTLQCLRSIAERSPSIAYEVIVVDDRSPDETAAVIRQMAGVRLLVNETNLGFIRSCNRGAAEARGRYLLFLNNDTEVGERWLDELHATFGEFAGVGLVGSKLLYPDGRLQEAGGIIWRDGSAWNFGRGLDPMDPAFNYARQVDYCSGASIMIEAALFQRFGGFDEHYLPAYGEDSDLALKVVDAGLKVMYQPLSMVIHHEGVTSGTDTSAGTKAYQVDNARKLYERWRDRLAAHEQPGVDADRAKDRGSRYRALVLDHCTPTPDQDAGSITALNLMLLLRQSGFQVTFVPEDNFLYMPDYTPELQRRGIEVIYAPQVTSVEQHLAAHGGRYDLVLIIRPTTADRHLARIRQHCPNAKILFHTSDVHFLRMSREAELMADETIRTAAENMRDLELRTMRDADAVIVHSTAEKELLESWLPGEPIHVFPWAIPIRGTTTPFAQRKDIAFIGGYQHYPNVDAVKHFVANIFPLIRAAQPGIRLLAIGSRPPQELLDLAGPDIEVTGFVDDLGPLLDTVRVAVAPLRYGAGIKGKIGTTLSIGLPCVSTSIGAEGMGLVHGDHVLIADEHAHFASAVLELYNDEATWNTLSTNGIEFARVTYGPDAARSCIETILRQLAFSVSFEEPFTIFGPTGRPETVHANFRADRPPTSLALAGQPQRPAALPAPVGESPDAATAAYDSKVEQELAIYARQLNVHDLPRIFHYWSNKYLVPLLGNADFQGIDHFFAEGLYRAARRTGSKRPRYLSVGAGNCDQEITVAKRLIAMGLTDFSLECIDFNPQMIERGRVAAIENGVGHVVQCTVADFNTWTPGDTTFDGIMANQSLHHVVALEHLFDQIRAGLAEQGLFVISDVIGRNGHQRWPEALDVVQQFWTELPERYRFNVLLDRTEPRYENWDCSTEGFEGIRAQDIVALLLERFHFETFVGFGNVIDIFVDRCFGHHFDPDEVWDRDFIDRLHAADEEGFRTGRLTPTHMLAMLGKQARPDRYVARGLTPEASVRVVD